MDDLSSKLTEILQDPARIQQIMDMASSMGLQSPEQVTQALQSAEVKEQKQERLVRALLPYLHPNRQARLERAMQISHLSRIAGAALRNAQIPSFREEQEHV